MFIVRFNDGEKHSVWNTNEEAEHQLEVLENSSIHVKDCYIEELDCNYVNGHYFV